MTASKVLQPVSDNIRRGHMRIRHPDHSGFCRRQHPPYSRVSSPAVGYKTGATSCSEDQAVSANNSRPISIRRISLVPAPISYNFASRNNRPVG